MHGLIAPGFIGWLCSAIQYSSLQLYFVSAFIKILCNFILSVQYITTQYNFIFLMQYIIIEYNFMLSVQYIIIQYNHILSMQYITIQDI